VAKSFHEYSTRAQIGVFALLCGLTVAAAWQTLLAPDQAEVTARESSLDAVRVQVSTVTAVARQLPRFEREVAALERSLIQTTAVLPDEKDAQDVLRQLHTLASASALDIRSFTPKPIATRPQYEEWPIELGLQGDYHDLGRFFDRVASLPLLISVSDLHMKTQMEPGSRGSVTVSCVATTYVFTHEPTPAPAGGKS
jgi:type IV pilus assembly protein PilO